MTALLGGPVGYGTVIVALAVLVGGSISHERRDGPDPAPRRAPRIAAVLVVVAGFIVIVLRLVSLIS